MTRRIRNRPKKERTHHPRPARGVSDSASQKVIEIYDALAERYALHYESGNPDKPLWDTFLKHVKKGSKLLDLGCGTGSTAGYFLQRGMQVEGVDRRLGPLRFTVKGQWA